MFRPLMWPSSGWRGPPPRHFTSIPSSSLCIPYRHSPNQYVPSWTIISPFSIFPLVQCLRMYENRLCVCVCVCVYIYIFIVCVCVCIYIYIYLFIIQPWILPKTTWFFNCGVIYTHFNYTCFLVLTTLKMATSGQHMLN